MQIQNKVYFIFLLCFLLACSKKVEYPIKVEMENNVKIISNPDYPRDGKFNHELIEELSIGLEDGDENYILNRPHAINVDINGTIYILDWGDINIKVYDKHGKFLRTIGRKGMGPGEINQPPLYFDLSFDGKIYIADSRNKRVAIFDTSGSHISGFSIYDGLLSNIKIFNNDTIFISKRFYEDEIRKLSIYKYNLDGKELLNYGLFKLHQPIIIKRDEKSSSSVSSPYAPNTVWTVSSDGFLYTGYGEPYQIKVFDLDGKIMHKFGREHNPVPITYKRDRLEGLPTHKSAFTRYWTFDQDGNLWIEIYTDDEIKDHVYDIFSPDGIYLKQITLKHRIYEMKDDYIYSIVRNDDDVPMVKRFKLIPTK
jgi:hypothetical protein